MYKDTVRKNELLCNQKLEHPLETELLIPDYLPGIFKIVKALVFPVILQKQVSGTKYAVEGYLRITLLYQSDGEEGLCAVEQKVPFQKQFELKSTSSKAVFGEVEGEIEYLNCRAVNQRRVDIRGAYYLTARVFGQAEEEIVTVISGEGVQQKVVPVQATSLVTQGDKQFTLEESLLFDTKPMAILYTNCRAQVGDVKVIAGKAVVKGEVTVEITYRAQGSSRLLKVEKTLPFNQIVDLEGATESCRCTVHIDVNGCTISTGESGEDTTVSATCLLNARVYKEGEYYAVKDAFSTLYEMEVEPKALITDLLCDTFTNTIEVKVGGPLPDDSAEIVDCLITKGPPELMEAEGGLAVHGKLTAHLICKNSLGEMECYDKTGEYTLPKRYALLPENAVFFAESRVVGCICSKSGAETSAEISLVVSGQLLERRSTEVANLAEAGDMLRREGDEAALIIYYAQKGEDVFYIAKHYHASPEKISRLAGLSGDVVEEKCQLLIPAAE